MSIWFTSDTHFNHSKIIDYNNRPFVDVGDMNDRLIENWNDSVGRRDEVWHLGDFSFGKGSVKSILDRLNGKINLVKGNHDEVNLKKDDFEMFYSVQHYKKFKSNKKKIILCHYPLRTWDGMYGGSYMLHGHSHSGPTQTMEYGRILDVGVDAWGYRPVNLETVISIMETVSPREGMNL